MNTFQQSIFFMPYRIIFCCFLSLFNIPVLYCHLQKPKSFEKKLFIILCICDALTNYPVAVLDIFIPKNVNVLITLIMFGMCSQILSASVSLMRCAKVVFPFYQINQKATICGIVISLIAVETPSVFILLQYNVGHTYRAPKYIYIFNSIVSLTESLVSNLASVYTLLHLYRYSKRSAGLEKSKNLDIKGNVHGLDCTDADSSHLPLSELTSRAPSHITRSARELTSRALSHPIRSAPEELTSRAPSHLTRSSPEELTSRAPSHLIRSAPKELTSTVPSHLTRSAPEELTSRTPSHLTRSAPEELTSRAPSHLTRSAPEELTSRAPSHLTRSAPEELTSRTPSHLTRSAPEEVTSLHKKRT